MMLLTVGPLVAAACGGEVDGDFYISPTGDDANPGTLDQPFATLNRARLAVRARIAGGIADDIWVYLRGGVYRIESPVVFDVVDSPPMNAFVHYAAYPGECPVISGGRRITNWTDHGDGTWTAIVPGIQAGEWTFRELFVNGRRRPRARHPNIGFLRVAGPNPAVGVETRFTFSYNAGDIPGGTDLSNAEINMLHEWTVSRVRVAQVAPAMHVLTTAEPLGAGGLFHSIFQYEDHPRYALENHPALLDAPGEWYLDASTGVLTYLPMPGEFAQTTEVVAPFATALLVVRGDFGTGEPVRNLRFLDLAFEHCAWALPAGGYSTYQSGNYEWRDTSTHYDLPAAITFERAQNCELTRIRLAHCGGWGVMLGAWCDTCRLVGSVISDIAGTGVLIGEDRYRHADGNQWYISRPDQVAIKNGVTSNLVQDCGVELQDSAGVWAGLTEGTIVQNNLIRRMPHIGLSSGGLWNTDPRSPCREMSILNNRISDVVQLLSDGGGIYTVGLHPGSSLRGNLISGIPPQPGLSQNNAIFIDEGSTGFQIIDNGVYNVARSPFKFHYAGLNHLVSNTMRLSAPDIEPYFMVNTDESNIVRSDEVIINPDFPPPDCDYPVCGEAESAGLLPEYLPSIFVDSDHDGIPNLEDACPDRAPGDANGDGVVDGRDIEPVARVLLDETLDDSEYCATDFDGDGIVSPADVDAIVALMIGTP